MGCWVDGWAAAGGHIKPQATTMCLARKLEVNGGVVESVVVDQPVVSHIYHQNMFQNNVLGAAVCLTICISGAALEILQCGFPGSMAMGLMVAIIPFLG